MDLEGPGIKPATFQIVDDLPGFPSHSCLAALVALKLINTNGRIIIRSLDVSAAYETQCAGTVFARVPTSILGN